MFGESFPLETKRSIRWQLLVIRLQEEAIRLEASPVRISVGCTLPNDDSSACCRYGKARWESYDKRAIRTTVRVLTKGTGNIPNASDLIVDGQTIGLVLAIGPRRGCRLDLLRKIVTFRPEGYEDWFRS